MSTAYRSVGLAAVCAALAVAAGAEPAGELRLFDTGATARGRLSAAATRERAGWRQVSDTTVSGDACIENGDLVFGWRHGGAGVEVYGRWRGDPHLAATVALCAPDAPGPGPMTGFEVLENTPAVVRLRARFAAPAGRSVAAEFVVRAGLPTLEVLPGAPGAAVVVRHASAYAVLPDFFGDDLVFEAATTKPGPVHLPGDNRFALHLLGANDAILMCNWLGESPYVPITAQVEAGAPVFAQTRIGCAPDAKVWVSVLAAPGIWRAEDSAAYTIFEDKQVDWQVPFAAAWRLDYQVAHGTNETRTDSWWNLRQGKDGKYVAVRNEKQALYYFTWLNVENQATRGSHCNGLGGNIYPFYTAGEKAVLRLPKLRSAKVEHKGRILIFPWLRADETPDDVVLPIDVLRRTLGDGFQTTLDIAGVSRRPSKSVYPATCGVTADVKKIFEEHQEKAKREHIKERLRLMDIFVKNHRERIHEYLDWAAGMAAFFEAERTAQPGLAALIDRLAPLPARLTKQFADAQDRIQTPEVAAGLSQQLLALVDSDAADKIEQCDQLGRDIRTIGGGQDGMLATFRSRVRELRQEAGLVAATDSDPAARELARQTRVRTQAILRVRFGMEGK